MQHIINLTKNIIYRTLYSSSLKHLVSVMEDITYIYKRTSVSSKPPVRPGKHYPLSVLDLQMERNHLRMVFYYPSSSMAGMETGTGKMSKRLRESLSEVLSHFRMITGRLEKNGKGEWMIKCNDAGVRTVEARAKGSVEEWLKCVDREKELKLVYWEDILVHKPYFWSTFYIQITEFEEGGLAIGLSCIHLLADPICATMFIKAWADTTFCRKMLSPPYIHPLPPRRPGNKKQQRMLYTSLINHYKFSIEKSKYTPLTDTKFTTIILSFTDHMVRTCMAMAQTITEFERSGPSPFEALAGLFWVCVSKAKGMRNGLVNMSICLDMRRVLGLDKGFFGNCMVYNKVYAEGFQENNNLSQAAKAIAKVTANMDNEGIMDLIEWLQHNDDQSPPLMNSCDLVCASLETMDSYLVTFEDGIAPVRVSYYVEPSSEFGQVLILPPRPAGDGMLSRVVMVTLPKEEVARLCEDDLILRFSPSILMGVNKA